MNGGVRSENKYDSTAKCDNGKKRDTLPANKSPLKRKKGLGIEMVESLATMIDGRKVLLEIEKEKFEYMKNVFQKRR